MQNYFGPSGGGEGELFNANGGEKKNKSLHIEERG
jgi:hypothetical protein